MPSNTLGPSAEAITPVAYFLSLITYHTAAAMVIMFQFLNNAERSTLFALNIALRSQSLKPGLVQRD